MDDNNSNEISIMDLIKILWLHKTSIIIFMIIAMVFTSIKLICFTQYTYTAKGILYVSNKKESVSKDIAIEKTDIDSSRTLSTTCIEILKTCEFLTDISNTVNNTYSWNQIQKMMTISSVSETELLSISIKAHSADDAYNIANDIMKKAPLKLQSVFKRSEIEIVDNVRYPEKPDDNKRLVKIFIGALAGAFIGFIYAYIKSLLDNKVHGSEDVEKRYNVSILGELR